jgi:hypothetical protein
VSTSALLDVLQAIVIPPLVCAGWWALARALRAHQYRFLAIWMWCAAVCTVLQAVQGQWPWALGDGISAAVAAWLFWCRRGRKRAPRAYGLKSRQRILKLVRRTQERARPKRVLRPIPGPG